VKRKKQTPIHHKVGRRVHLAVIPHKKNAYQPHLVRWKGIIAVLIAIIALNLAYFGFDKGEVLSQFNSQSMNQLLSATNAERAKNHVDSLTLNAKLVKAAALKARDMFEHQYWSHTSPTGVQPWAWFARAGYDYEYAGENLAQGFRSASGVVTAWMGSPDHRDNLLKREYTDVGFAVVSGKLDGKETTVIVALYGTPKTSGSTVLSPAVLASTSSTFGPVTRFGVALQSMSPSILGSLVVIAVMAGVALLAHAYRRRLPKAIQRDWRQHHGVYKAIGMVSLAIVIIMLYSDGQI
jgi:uncharacterized protein YkwD